MDYALFDLHSDYLLSSFAATTATGLSRLMNDDLSHDQVSSMLSSGQLEFEDCWRMIERHVRAIEREDGVLAIAQPECVLGQVTNTNADNSDQSLCGGTVGICQA